MAVLEAKAIAVDPIHVFCGCPYCGKVHLHGSNGDITEIDYGSRVPHCYPATGQYIIIADEKTVRREDQIADGKAALRLYRRRA